MPVRTIALRALLVSIIVGTLLGIVGILGGGIGQTGLKILLSSFSISAASALVLASAAAWKLPAALVPSRVGLGATLAALAMMLAGMWMEIDIENYWRVAATFAVTGGAGALSSLLSLARLAP